MASVVTVMQIFERGDIIATVTAAVLTIVIRHTRIT